MHVYYDKIICSTKKAILFVINSRFYWIPKSQIISANNKEKRIVLKIWWATKYGLCRNKSIFKKGGYIGDYLDDAWDDIGDLSQW